MPLLAEPSLECPCKIQWHVYLWKVFSLILTDFQLYRLICNPGLTDFSLILKKLKYVLMNWCIRTGNCSWTLKWLCLSMLVYKLMWWATVNLTLKYWVKHLTCTWKICIVTNQFLTGMQLKESLCDELYCIHSLFCISYKKWWS